MKKSKLILQRQTVRLLVPTRLARVVGGNAADPELPSLPDTDITRNTQEMISRLTCP